jgi:glycosyltransferase involved in cell wall biosynthesis
MLFWFSQTIGKGRGLENFIKASARVFPQPSLTLLGNCSTDVQEEFILLAEEEGFDLDLLFFKSVLQEAELFSEASKHHIGICSEDPLTINRDLCLTNKIFTYMLGKNALLLSKTMAQIEFHEKNIGIGTLYNLNDIDEITKSIQLYQDDRELLNQHRSNSFQIAKEQLNWGKESEKLTFYYKELLLE